MSELFVVVEHRQGQVRDLTYEMLAKADELARSLSSRLTAVVLGGGEETFFDALKGRADRVVSFRDPRLATFNSELYQAVLLQVLKEDRPFITLIGHSPWGMDLASALSIQSGRPLATDCVDIAVEGEVPRVIRQIYSGKVLSRVSLAQSDGYLMTVRPGAFSSEPERERTGEIEERETPSGLPDPRVHSEGFIDTSAGEVDITQSDLLVSVGRGVGDEENVSAIKELARALGGTMACSRPVVDKHWLPKFYQVGTSGKSVKPKVYLALGISGAFQHLAGISGAGTVIAVNKDRKAPIFRAADYGVVEDLFRIADALKEQVAGQQS